MKIIAKFLQGEMVDRIENHVLTAGEAVEEALKQTKKAVVYRSKSRKVITFGILNIIQCQVK